MDILWISYKGDCLDIARILRDEGHNVLVYIQELPYTLPVDDAIGYVSSWKPYYQDMDLICFDGVWSHLDKIMLGVKIDKVFLSQFADLLYTDYDKQIELIEKVGLNCDNIHYEYYTSVERWFDYNDWMGDFIVYTAGDDIIIQKVNEKDVSYKNLNLLVPFLKEIKHRGPVRFQRVLINGEFYYTGISLKPDYNIMKAITQHFDIEMINLLNFNQTRPLHLDKLPIKIVELKDEGSNLGE